MNSRSDDIIKSIIDYIDFKTKQIDNELDDLIFDPSLSDSNENLISDCSYKKGQLRVLEDIHEIISKKLGINSVNNSSKN